MIKSGENMKITWKDCFKIVISILIIYLCVFYWENVANLLGVLLSASLPIIFGLVIPITTILG